MCNCESSSVRTSGRRAMGARRPRTPKPNISYVSVACRGGGCAVKFLNLTRGGPWMWPHDNNDLDGLTKPERERNASRGIGRTHSSRKTFRRGPAWRHAARVKRKANAVKAGSWKEGDCGGKGVNTQEGKQPTSCRKARHGKAPNGPAGRKRRQRIGLQRVPGGMPSIQTAKKEQEPK
jgi:hypothetical protein